MCAYSLNSVIVGRFPGNRSCDCLFFFLLSDISGVVSFLSKPLNIRGSWSWSEAAISDFVEDAAP